MHLQLEYVLFLQLFFIIHQKDCKIVIFDVITFYFEIFLTYVNTIEYVYFASACNIYFHTRRHDSSITIIVFITFNYHFVSCICFSNL